MGQADIFFQIQWLDKSYVPDLISLEKKCFARPWTRDQFEKCMASRFFKVLGAVDNRKLLGYLFFLVADEEVEIINLAVDPGRRRCGLAWSLLRHLVHHCWQWKIRIIFLEVRPSNAAALTLYSRAGFRQTGRRKNYYPDNLEDAWIMTLELQDFPLLNDCL